MNIIIKSLSLLCIAIPFSVYAENNEPIEGLFAPFSRACWGNPGEIEIKPNKISFSNCKNAKYNIVRNFKKYDGFWYGSTKEKEKKEYRDFAIHIDRTKYCPSENKAHQKYIKEVFRLLISEKKVIFLEYANESTLNLDKYTTWCAYTKR